MLRYKLRTLMIVLALGPPVLAAMWFTPPQTLLPIAYCGVLALLTIFNLWSAIRV